VQPGRALEAVADRRLELGERAGHLQRRDAGGAPQLGELADRDVLAAAGEQVPARVTTSMPAAAPLVSARSASASASIASRGVSLGSGSGPGAELRDDRDTRLNSIREAHIAARK
jgi:hypothetical protein